MPAGMGAPNESLNKDYMSRCSELITQNEKYRQKIESLEKELAEYETKNEFEYQPGRQALIIKLGDSGKGWIPGSDIFAKVRRFVKDTQLDKKYNVLLFNYAFNMQVIE